MNRICPAVYAAGILLFGLLAYLIHRFHVFAIDNTMNQWFSGSRQPLLDEIMEAVSFAGNIIPSIVTVSLVAVVLFFLRKRLEAIFVIVVPAVATLINWLLKILIDRPRPGDIISDGGLSFPSGHTTHAVVFCGLLFYLAPKLVNNSGMVVALRSLLILTIILIAFSRFYLGEHWPSDILGSIILGGLILYPAIAIYRHQKEKSRMVIKDA
jgi:undecaprenyl-diphosphatase